MKGGWETPLILGFVADLFFVVKIQSIADKLNYRVKWIESADQIAPPDPNPPSTQLGEHITGRGAALLDNITSWQPAIIIFDLNNQAIPWVEWISLVTSVSATRRIPVLCFGSHTDSESIKLAKSAGAKAVVARSGITRRLPGLIQKYARVTDREALADSCSRPLSEAAIRGLEEFNRGAYFEAHEYLEKAWMSDMSVGRDLYRAILQIAVAYYQILRGNYNGAIKIFLRVRQWIDP